MRPVWLLPLLEEAAVELAVATVPAAVLVEDASGKVEVTTTVDSGRLEAVLGVAVAV